MQIKRTYRVPSAAEVVAAVQVRRERIKTLRAETRMSHRSSQGKVKATVRLMVQRGGKLRCDVISPLDTPLTTLVSNGKTFTLVDAEKNRHYYGPATPCNLARLLQVVLQPDDVLAILGGSTPLIDFTTASLRWDDQTGEEVLTLQGQKLRQTIRLDGDQRSWNQHLSEVTDQAGQTLLRITMDDFQTRAGLAVPQQIKVEQPQHKTSLEVTFKSEELNISLPPVAFEPIEADGLPSQQVDCTTEVKP